MHGCAGMMAKRGMRITGNATGWLINEEEREGQRKRAEKMKKGDL